MAHIGDNPVAVDLSTVQYRIPTTVDGDGFTAVCCGFSPLSTVTFLAAFCRINAGKDADTGTVTTAPILTPTPPPLLLFLPVVFCVFAAPLNRISFAASRLVLPPP